MFEYKTCSVTKSFFGNTCKFFRHYGHSTVIWTKNFKNRNCLSVNQILDKLKIY